MASDCPCCGDPRPPVHWSELAVSLDECPFWAGRAFHLTPQHLSLLHHLTRRAPHAAKRDALFMSSMNEDTDNPTLTVQVSLMIKALRRQAPPPRRQPARLRLPARAPDLIPVHHEEENDPCPTQ